MVLNLGLNLTLEVELVACIFGLYGLAFIQDLLVISGS